MNKKNRKILYAVFAASSLGLAGCSMFTKNAYTDNWQVSNTTKGFAVGAATGAAIGGVANASSGWTGGLAAGGAVVGAGAGYAMDQKEARVREILRGTGVRVLENVNDGSNDITLVMPSEIYFAPGSAALSPACKRVLDSVAMVMKEFKYSVAEIPGNADSVGSWAYNKRLSQRRAQAVADYLCSRGIRPERLVPCGYSEDYPVASNRTTGGRSMNRRVCVILHQPPIDSATEEPAPTTY